MSDPKTWPALNPHMAYLFTRIDVTDRKTAAALHDEVFNSLTALSATYLDALSALGTKVYIPADMATMTKICGAGTAVGTSGSNTSLVSCVVNIPGTTTAASAVSGLTIVIAPNVNAVKQSLVRTVGYVFTQRLGRLKTMLGSVMTLKPTEFAAIEETMTLSFLQDMEDSQGMFSLSTFAGLLGSNVATVIPANLKLIQAGKLDNPFTGLKSSAAQQQQFLDYVMADAFDSANCRSYDNSVTAFDPAVAQQALSTHNAALLGRFTNTRKVFQTFFPKTWQSYQLAGKYFDALAQAVATSPVGTRAHGPYANGNDAVSSLTALGPTLARAASSQRSAKVSNGSLGLVGVNSKLSSADQQTLNQSNSYIQQLQNGYMPPSYRANPANWSNWGTSVRPPDQSTVASWISAETESTLQVRQKNALANAQDSAAAQGNDPASVKVDTSGAVSPTYAAIGAGASSVKDNVVEAHAQVVQAASKGADYVNSSLEDAKNSASDSGNTWLAGTLGATQGTFQGGRNVVGALDQTAGGLANAGSNVVAAGYNGGGSGAASSISEGFNGWREETAGKIADQLNREEAATGQPAGFGSTVVAYSSALPFGIGTTVNTAQNSYAVFTGKDPTTGEQLTPEQQTAFANKQGTVAANAVTEAATAKATEFISGKVFGEVEVPGEGEGPSATGTQLVDGKIPTIDAAPPSGGASSISTAEVGAPPATTAPAGSADFGTYTTTVSPPSVTSVTTTATTAATAPTTAVTSAVPEALAEAAKTAVIEGTNTTSGVVLDASKGGGEGGAAEGGTAGGSAEGGSAGEGGSPAPGPAPVSAPGPAPAPAPAPAPDSPPPDSPAPADPTPECDPSVDEC